MLRLGPLGGSGAGFRVWLLDSQSARVGGLGGAIRRLRQRCAGGHRPVHRCRRSQVGAGQWLGPAAAAWLRRAGPGAFFGAHRALHAALCRDEHGSLPAIDTSAGLPHVAPASAAQPAQTLDRLFAEIAASPQGRDVHAGRVERRRISARDRRSRTDQCQKGHPSGLLLRQDLLRTGGCTARAEDLACRDCPPRAVLSLPAGLVPGRTGQVSESHGGRLVSG
ncbi:MAG: hypothetical protein AW09_001448 [Candidatus Accumulibacter phosphatis]|uniref:Uncharacterized protein n=1 Tax=Candidatus Accumulibacter phosphatis TaxID=327160 RepID=A0A080M834_9PROT|nr:MAG: hypothetical protein AW09_001448 [Candidatus Accumulibacter phosphatis]